jgi:surface protein
MKVCNFSLGKFFIFLCFSFISIFNLSASCVKVEKPYFIFLPEDGDECVDKSKNGALPLYSNFEVLIPGKTRNGYTIELVFDRDNQAELSGEQSLFAFYSREDNVNPVYELVLRGSSVFYKINNEEQDGVDLSVAEINDPDIIEPHSIVITHDNFNNILYLNIDSGADLEIKNVPKVNVAYIGKVELGKNYVGEIGEMRIWGVKFNINQRSAAARLLAGMTGAKISTIETVKDENGITTSAVPKVNLIKCQNNMIVINGECNNAIITGFIPPSNSIYNGGSDGKITYDPIHDGKENAKLLDCNVGYEAGDTSPKYWFTADNGVVSAHIEGSCVEKTYILGQDGNDALPANATDPGILTFSSLANYTSSNPQPLECDSGYEKSSDIGVYLDSNDILKAQGSCTYINVAPSNCYDTLVFTAGSICNGMLVVDRDMLNSSRDDGSFDFKPEDPYTTHTNGITYSWANNDRNIFTGQVTTMVNLLYGYSNFNEDISYWDTSNVTTMGAMFRGATSFNQDISGWDTGEVTTMSNMFRDSSFNGKLSNWNTSKVMSMSGMFAGNSAFNQDISGWDTGNVESMALMFQGASSFNKNISGWNTGKVKRMYSMFQGASSFNQDISGWDTGSATKMYSMFQGASSFNPTDLNNNPVALNWDTKNVTDMSYMFYNSIFSGDISNWNTGNVTNMNSMFRGSQFNKNISSWNTGKVASMGRMFDGNNVFNHDLSGWCVGLVSDVAMVIDNNNNNTAPSFINSSTFPSNYLPPFGTADNCPPVAP